MNELMIISHYYPPEMGAASNRIHTMADGLKNNFKVCVVTPLPNYPEGKVFKGYANRLKQTKIENGIKIHRLWIYPSNSNNKFVRVLSMFSYSLSLAVFFLFQKIPKTVIIQSPPLLVAFTSILFLKRKSRKLVLNVSDLWPDAAIDLGVLNKGRKYRWLKKIESFNYKNANLIFGQSNEILNHVSSITELPEYFLYRNYPVIKGLPNLKERCTDTRGKIKIVYAGLIGVAQGIVKLCKNINYENIEFHIYGSGAEAHELEHFIKATPSLPVFYHGSLIREALHQILVDYDVAIIPLTKRIYGSVPSKIFELAAIGIPVIYFGGGEGEQIVRENNLGWVIEPSNYKALCDFIQYQLREELTTVSWNKNRTIFKTKFNSASQIKQLIDKL